MWPFRRRQKRESNPLGYVWKPSRGEILDMLQDDEARYDQCLAWAEEERNKFYQGLRETIQDIVTSNSERYRDYGSAARRTIGEVRWSQTAKSKELAGNEQMYMRWAQSYKNSPRSGLGRRWTA